MQIDLLNATPHHRAKLRAQFARLWSLSNDERAYIRDRALDLRAAKRAHDRDAQVAIVEGVAVENVSFPDALNVLDMLAHMCSDPSTSEVVITALMTLSEAREAPGADQREFFVDFIRRARNG